MLALDEQNALLIYRVGPVLCCSPTLHVLAIIQPPAVISHPPGSSSSFPGIFKYLNYIVRVIDLPYLFGLESRQAASGRYVITELGGKHYAFWVDDIIDVIKRPGQGWGGSPHKVPADIFPSTLVFRQSIHLFAEFDSLAGLRRGGQLQEYVRDLLRSQAEDQGRAVQATEVTSGADSLGVALNIGERSIAPAQQPQPTEPVPAGQISGRAGHGDMAVDPVAAAKSTGDANANPSFSAPDSLKVPGFKQQGVVAQQKVIQVKAATAEPSKANVLHKAIPGSTERKAQVFGHSSISRGSDLPSAAVNTKAGPDSLASTYGGSRAPARVSESLSRRISQSCPADFVAKSTFVLQEKRTVMPETESNPSRIWFLMPLLILLPLFIWYLWGLRGGLVDDRASEQPLVVRSVDKVSIQHQRQDKVPETVTDKVDVAVLSDTEDKASDVTDQAGVNEARPGKSLSEDGGPLESKTLIQNDTLSESVLPAGISANMTSESEQSESITEDTGKPADREYLASIEQHSDGVTIVLSSNNPLETLLDISQGSGTEPGDSTMPDAEPFSNMEQQVATALPPVSSTPSASPAPSVELEGLSTKPGASDEGKQGHKKTKALEVFKSSVSLALDANTQSVNDRALLHIVVPGDTLWAIAKRYVRNPYLYPELARLSKIKNPDLIYPGDRVRIVIKSK